MPVNMVLDAGDDVQKSLDRLSIVMRCSVANLPPKFDIESHEELL